MKFTGASAIFLASLAAAMPVSDTGAGLVVREADANLPGLDAQQSTNARAIMGEVKAMNLNAHACQAAISTALTESHILRLANHAVPSSFDYPHDGVGSDHDSVGIFQQRAIYYPNIKEDMDAAGSASEFLNKMKNINGWQNIAVAKLDQDVQVSADPDAYEPNVAPAEKICSAYGF